MYANVCTAWPFVSGNSDLRGQFVLGDFDLRGQGATSHLVRSSTVCSSTQYDSGHFL